MRVLGRFFVVCVLLTLTRKAVAFCYAPRLRVSDEYYVSDIVLTGTVVDSKNMRDPHDPEFFVGIYYTIRIDSTYRGKSYRSLHIYSENTTARFPMDRGVRYVLFLTHDAQKNWVVDNCGNSAATASGLATMEQLKLLPLKQSFVYGDVYSWEDNKTCSPMQLILRSGKGSVTTEVKADCSFEVATPPGRYEAILRRNGKPIAPNGLDYKDAYCFVVPVGGSAGIAFRLADGSDQLRYLLRDDARAKSLCSKSQNPQHLLWPD